MAKNSKRRGRWLKIAAAAIVVLTFATCLRSYSRLSHFGKFINTEYANELLAIENAVLRPPADSSSSSISSSEALESELEHTFDSNVFYLVGVSYDGHHGPRSIKFPPEGYIEISTFFWWSPMVSAQLGNHSTICFGRSHKGEPLLIYTKRIPDAPIWKHIRLMFSQKELAEQMAKNKKP